MPPTRWGTNKTKILFGWACRPAGRRPLVRVSAPAGPPCGAGGPLSAPPRPWVGCCGGARLVRPRRATPDGAALAWGWPLCACGARSTKVVCYLATAASGPCYSSIDQPWHIKARAVGMRPAALPHLKPREKKKDMAPLPCLPISQMPSPMQLCDLRTWPDTADSSWHRPWWSPCRHG